MPMLTRLVRLIVALLALIGLAAVTGGLWLLKDGISARPQPGALETTVARRLRALAIPSAAVARTNPVPVSDEVVKEGMAHFADHCASCHGNDGGGDTEMGRGLYPKAPDMRLDATQALSDGTLFYIIEEGVKLTGMPAWSTGTPEGEEASWGLVHFIRRLPALTEAEKLEMEALNPKSQAEWQEAEEIRRFLEGDSDTPDPPSPAQPPHKHR
jgi:mono/diheme cytochrome c family protein